MGEYDKQLKEEMGPIDSLKQLLNVITDIKAKSMDMELRIKEVKEHFWILTMHGYEVEKETQMQVEQLEQDWADLLD